MLKTCRRCGECKALEQFHIRTDSPDGRQLYCKACQTAMVSRQDAMALAARRREYRLTHLDEVRQRERTYRIHRRDHRNALARQAYARNRQAILAQRRIERQRRRMAQGLPPIGRPGRPIKLRNE